MTDRLIVVPLDGSELAETALPPALALARRSPEYREEAIGSACTHRALFDTQAAGTLRELFRLVGDRPGTEVLVDGKPVPYARELWLPLFWLFVGEGS